MVISWIIPALNEQEYLPRCLGSLRYSTAYFHDFEPASDVETIVVDNGSVDRTAEIAHEFGAHVVAEPRPGIAIARNSGVSAARGDVLIFIDADYRVTPRFVSGVHRHFARTDGAPAVGVRVRLEPTEVGQAARFVSNTVLASLRMFGSMSFGVFALHRNAFEALGGFDESFFAFEDVDLLKRIRDGMSYCILNDVVVYASARGFSRGKMLSTYLHMALHPSDRRRRDRCGYWYDRRMQ